MNMRHLRDSLAYMLLGAALALLVAERTKSTSTEPYCPRERTIETALV